jgi:uncharacterized protein (TIGR02117 family)
MLRYRLASACLALGLLTVACSVPDVDPPPPADAFVYVIGRDWHTDIGLPVEEITGPLAVLEKDLPGVRVLTFGFGERQFLMDRDTSIITMLKALLPSRSALLMTALRTTPEVAFGQANVVVLPISRAGLREIEESIWEEFELTPAGEPSLLAEGPYPGSVFYAANETYYGLFTCNTWTADTLGTGGLPVAATGVLFAGQVMGMARWFAARHAASPKN